MPSISLEALPISESLQSLDDTSAYELALSGGDDYELCFTVPQEQEAFVEKELLTQYQLTRVGKVTNDNGKLVLKDAKGEVVELKASGWRHF